MNNREDSMPVGLYITMLIAITLIGVLIITCQPARAQTTYRDRTNKVLGTASTSKTGTTTFRDNTGKVVGTAKQSGKTTTYRDNTGKVIASETSTKTTPPKPILLLKGKK